MTPLDLFQVWPHLMADAMEIIIQDAVMLMEMKSLRTLSASCIHVLFHLCSPILHAEYSWSGLLLPSSGAVSSKLSPILYSTKCATQVRHQVTQTKWKLSPLLPSIHFEELDWSVFSLLWALSFAADVSIGRLSVLLFCINCSAPSEAYRYHLLSRYFQVKLTSATSIPQDAALQSYILTQFQLWIASMGGDSLLVVLHFSWPAFEFLDLARQSCAF